LPPNSRKEIETVDSSINVATHMIELLFCDEEILRKVVKFGFGFLYAIDCNRRLPNQN
jgi:hypothetical protein